MRILSWNMRCKGKPQTWRTLLDFNVDIALLQEAAVPPEVANRYTVHFQSASRKTGTSQGWGSAVLVRRDWTSEKTKFECTRRPWVAEELAKWGACVPVVLHHGDRRILLISAYVPAWRTPSSHLSEAQKSEVRLPSLKRNDIWLVDFLWAYLADELGSSEALIGGDFNSSILFDRTYGGKGNGNVEIQARMIALGLGDLLRVTSPDPISTPTFLAPRNAKPYQLDYLYATSDLRASTTSCVTGQMELIRLKVSDHLPVVAEIDL